MCAYMFLYMCMHVLCVYTCLYMCACMLICVYVCMLFQRGLSGAKYSIVNCKMHVTVAGLGDTSLLALREPADHLCLPATLLLNMGTFDINSHVLNSMILVAQHLTGRGLCCNTS